MFKSLLYKEWIKLRLYWLLLLGASLVFHVYLCLQLRHIYALNEPMAIWSNWINKGLLFFRMSEYVPLLLGVVLACLQFFPEVQGKRFRLILHLPIAEEPAVAAHLVAGLLLLTMVFAPGIVLLAASASVYFPAEFQNVLLMTVFPWVLAGYAGYLLGATTILEPTWRHRVFHLLLAAGVVNLFFFDSFLYNSYQRIIPAAALLVAALTLLPLVSSDRFGKGYGS